MDLTGVSWHKSSYSGGNGGDCIEVAEVWRKSSYSGGNGGDCVEVARTLPAAIAVRDSKDPDGPALVRGGDDPRLVGVDHGLDAVA